MTIKDRATNLENKIKNGETVDLVKELTAVHNNAVSKCYEQIIECFPVLTCVTTLSICLGQLKE